ncbi:unnamed protein product [Owenia fusiformis]|uniref:UBA domain-containing protein n=1 Tax=Owenia fusiformis TaxID=6347 RepID=A0A8S4PP03_OWEFU|nr:unnamed protein product [Owenia fusiformis]
MASDETEDCYKILGIEANPTWDDIHRAYRKKALQYHPDRSLKEKGDSSDAKFTEITAAYKSIIADDIDDSLDNEQIFFNLFQDVLLSNKRGATPNADDMYIEDVEQSSEFDKFVEIINNSRNKGKPVPDEFTNDKLDILREQFNEEREIYKADLEERDSSSKSKPSTQVQVLKPKPKSKKQKAAEQKRREREMEKIADELAEKQKLEEVRAEKKKKAEIEKQKRNEEERIKQLAEDKKQKEREEKERLEREKRDKLEEHQRLAEEEEKRKREREKEEKKKQKATAAKQKQQEQKAKEDEERKKKEKAKQQLAASQAAQLAAQQRNYPPREVPPRFAQKQQTQQQKKSPSSGQVTPQLSPQSTTSSNTSSAQKIASQTVQNMQQNTKKQNNTAVKQNVSGVSDQWSAGTGSTSAATGWGNEEPGDGGWSSGAHTSGSGWTDIGGGESDPQVEGADSGWGVSSTTEANWGGLGTSLKQNSIVIDTKDKEQWPSIGNQSESASEAGDADNASVKSGSVISSSSNPGVTGSIDLGQGSSAIQVAASSGWGSTEEDSGWGDVPTSQNSNTVGGWNSSNSTNQQATVNMQQSNPPVSAPASSSSSGSSAPDTQVTPATSGIDVSSSLGWGTSVAPGSSRPPGSILSNTGAQGGESGPTSAIGGLFQGINFNPGSLPGLQNPGGAKESGWNMNSGLSISSNGAESNVNNAAIKADGGSANNQQFGVFSGGSSGWGVPPTTSAPQRQDSKASATSSTGWGDPSPNASPNPNSAGWGNPTPSSAAGQWGSTPGGSAVNSQSGQWGQNPANPNPATEKQQQPASFANAAAKGLNLAAQQQQTPAQLQARSQREEIEAAINDPTGWGRGVKQDSQWDCALSPKSKRKNPEDDSVWHQPNDGTAIWESSKVNKEPPGPRPGDCPNWDNPPPQPATDGWNNKPPTQSANSDWEGRRNNPESWNNGQGRSNEWGGTTNSVNSRPNKEWGGAPNSNQWNGNPSNQPPPNNQPPPGNQSWGGQQGPPPNRAPGGPPPNGWNSAGNNQGRPSNSGWDSKPNAGGSDWNNPPPAVNSQNSGWGGSQPNGPTSNNQWGNQQAPPQQPPPQQNNWGGSNPQQANSNNEWGQSKADTSGWGGTPQQPAQQAPGPKMSSSSWDSTARGSTSSWGDGSNTPTTPGPQPTGWTAGPPQAIPDVKKIEPTGWGDASPPSSRKNGSNIDAGTSFWGDPKSQKPQGWGSQSSAPTTPQTPGPPGAGRKMEDYNRMNGQKPNGGWGDATGPDNPTNDAAGSLWGSTGQQQKGAPGQGGGWGDNHWTGGPGGQQSAPSGPKPQGWGDNDNGSWNAPGQKRNNSWNEGGSKAWNEDTDMGEWTSDAEKSALWSSAPGPRPNTNSNWDNRDNNPVRKPSFPTGGAMTYNKQPQMRVKLLQQLMEMGFKKDEAQHALINNNLNLESAIADLLHGANKDEINLTGLGGLPGRRPTSFQDQLADHISDTQTDANSFNVPVIPGSMHNTPTTTNAQLTNLQANSVKGPSLNPSLSMPTNHSINPSLQQKLILAQQQQQQQPTANNPPQNQQQQQAAMRNQMQQPPPLNNPQMVHQQLQNQIVQQLRMAVQAGLINQSLLNQQLTPQMLTMLQHLLQLQAVLQRLLQQQQILQQQKNANPQQQRQQLGEIMLMIQKIKQQILSQQQSIAQAQQPEGPQGNQAMKQDVLTNLPSDLSQLKIGADIQPKSKSRLEMWKLPSPEKDEGAGLNKAPGSKLPIHQSHSTPNLQSKIPELPSVGGDNPWSTSTSSSSNWPTSSAITSTSQSETDPKLESPANAEADDMIAEFVPGKPWAGFKTIEDDPNMTPGSIASSYSVATPKEESIQSLLNKTTMGTSATQSFSSGRSLSTSSATSWSTGDAPSSTSPWNATSKASAAPARPPPGLGGKNSRPGLNRSESWAPGERSAFQPVSSSGSMYNNNNLGWMVMSNLSAQFDGNTLKALCAQHGLVRQFFPNLSYGHALVCYASLDEAMKAQKALNNCPLGGSSIQAEVVTEGDAQKYVEMQNSLAPTATAPSAINAGRNSMWGGGKDPGQWNGSSFGLQGGMWGGSMGGGGLWDDNHHNLLTENLLGGQSM